MIYQLKMKRSQKCRCKAAVITKQLVAGIPVVDVSAPDMVTAQDAVKDSGMVQNGGANIPAASCAVDSFGGDTAGRLLSAAMNPSCGLTGKVDLHLLSNHASKCAVSILSDHLLWSRHWLY